MTASSLISKTLLPADCYFCDLQKLCGELEQLNQQRASLEAQVAKLAQGGASQLSALEAASSQLAAVAGRAEEAELQWLELAELAGDL